MLVTYWLEMGVGGWTGQELFDNGCSAHQCLGCLFAPCYTFQLLTFQSYRLENHFLLFLIPTVFLRRSQNSQIILESCIDVSI